RVVTHLGPGPAREVVADLLNGSRFNYVLLGAPGSDSALTRVVLVAKSPSESMPPPAAPAPQQGMAQATPVPGQPQEMPQPEMNDPANAEGNEMVDDNADQQPPPESAEQANPDQPQVKTPQQMLQEMQQRQMQLQMQQQPGQPPVPGSGMPPHPPQEQ
ncbi:MAG TPA: hypothetical protein VFA67_05045, partial [Candidatus Sulfotelmatobacter sp.]|nr:hypothetical protein [Candidatus Sulfotelmatobacter sp.]